MAAAFALPLAAAAAVPKAAARPKAKAKARVGRPKAKAAASRRPFESKLMRDEKMLDLNIQEPSVNVPEFKQTRAVCILGIETPQANHDCRFLLLYEKDHEGEWVDHQESDLAQEEE